MRYRLLVLIIILSGCDIQKRAVKGKENRSVKEQTETITKRVGDTVHYKIPNIILKDTTIYKTNRVTGTTQVVRYNDRGQIDMLECISGAIEEITRSNRELVEAIKNKDSEKTENFDSSFVLYIVLGVVLIAVVGLLLLFKTVRNNSAALTSILNKI